MGPRACASDSTSWPACRTSSSFLRPISRGPASAHTTASTSTWVMSPQTATIFISRLPPVNSYPSNSLQGEDDPSPGSAPSCLGKSHTVYIAQGMSSGNSRKHDGQGIGADFDADRQPSSRLPV